MLRSVLLLFVIAGCGKSKEPAASAGSGSAADKVVAIDAAPSRFADIEFATVASAEPPPAMDAPTVTASLTSLKLDDELVASLGNGKLPFDALEGGALGMKIIKLAAATAKLATARGAAAEATRIALALDARLTYGLLVQTIYSMKGPNGFTHFDLVVRSKGILGSLPIDLPNKQAVGAAAAGDVARAPGSDLAAQIEEVRKSGRHVVIGGGRNPRTRDSHIAPRRPRPADRVTEDDVAKQLGDSIAVDDPKAAPSEPIAPIEPIEPSGSPDDQPVQLIVSISNTDILLWSISQLEGTIQQPKLKVARTAPDALAQLGDALAEIVKRRWPNAGTNRESTIILQADKEVPIQLAADVIATLRKRADGSALFPEIQLAAGFE